jgi:hypothetical protein
MAWRANSIGTFDLANIKRECPRGNSWSRSWLNGEREQRIPCQNHFGLRLKNFWTTYSNFAFVISIYNRRKSKKGGCNMRTDILEQKDQILQWIEEKQSKAYMSK